MSPQVAFAGTKDAAAAKFIKAVDGMMIQLGSKSSRAAATINDTYRQHLDFLVLQEYAAIEGALGTGGLVRLPSDSLRFNVKVRVDGPAPIGEKDLDNQATYIAARAAALGALFEVASRVKSGPVEVTSLVRHSEYQEALRKTNNNARTSVPTHTMGLAFDIALVNTPLRTVYEIRDVLGKMQAAGQILVIGERKQLVFHVVPHPSRLGYFNDVYARAMAAVSAGERVIPSAPIAYSPGPLQPTVTADVVAVYPTPAYAREWWAAVGARSDLTISVSPSAPASATLRDSMSHALRDSVSNGLSDTVSQASVFTRLAARCATVFSSVFRWFRD